MNRFPRVVLVTAALLLSGSGVVWGQERPGGPPLRVGVATADYPYFLQQALQDEFGEAFVSIFGTGCGGGGTTFSMRDSRALSGSAWKWHGASLTRQGENG